MQLTPIITSVFSVGRMRFLTILVCCLLTQMGLLGVEVAAAVKYPFQQNITSEEYRPGELLVKFRKDLPSPEKTKVHGRMQAEKIREFTGTDLEHVRLKTGVAVEDALALYRKDSAVEYAEPNYVRTVLGYPNDPEFGQLWGMTRIAAPQAWDITTGSRKVVVAVIDTGVDYLHPDLSGNLWNSRGIFGYNAITGTNDPMDDNGHGTHVAGTIGALGNNSVGVVGVNWQVKILSCKAFDASGMGTDADIIACLQYVREKKDSGVNIVATNNSYGGGPYSAILNDTIRAQGEILFVAAAGNDRRDNDKWPTYPAGYDLPNIIAVAATDAGDEKADFSNSGRRTVHVGAPGVGIFSTLPGQNVWNLTGGYGALSGTSMAAPHVAGLAALIKGQNLARDWRQVKNLILSGGDPVAAMEQATISGKRINAARSLTCAGRPLLSAIKFPRAISSGVPAVVSALSIDCGSPVGPVTITTADGSSSQLLDDGISPDLSAGDGVFTGMWIPVRDAERLTFSSPAGTDVVFTPPLEIATRYLPEANPRAPYNQTLEVNGGKGPYAWTLLTPGDLPPGLVFSAGPAGISGNATLPGNYAFTVQAADSIGNSVTTTLSIKVARHDFIVEQWARTFDMSPNDWPYRMEIDGQGNVLVTGPTTSPENGSYDILTIKYDAQGGLLWSRIFDRGYDTAFDLVTDSLDNAYVVGHSDADMVILKYDPQGNLVASKVMDGGSNDGAWAAAIDSADNVYVLAKYADITVGVLKFDPAGTLLWSWPIAGWENARFNRIAVDGEGNCLVTGDNFNGNDNDLVTVKFAPSGDQLWAMTHDGGPYGYGNGIVADGAGNIYVAGISVAGVSPATRNDYLLIKYDPAGNVIWTRTYEPGGSSAHVSDLATDAQGNLYVAGYEFALIEEANDFLTLKYDPAGSLLWAKRQSGWLAGSGQAVAADEQLPSVAVSQNGDVFVAGRAYHSGNTDILTVKYSQLEPGLSILTSQLAPAVVGSPYQAALTGLGGAAPYTWSIASGSPPPGLNLSEGEGTISGLPTTPGEYPFTVRLADQANHSTEKSFAIKVFLPPAISTSALPDGYAGSPYSTTLVGTGGSGFYSWEVVSGSLPPGLVLSSDGKGVISGIPSVTGTYEFTVQLHDSEAGDVAKTLSLTIAAAGKVTMPFGWMVSTVALKRSSANNLSISTFGVPPGAQRLLLVSVVMEFGKVASPLISATYGGKQLTQIAITSNAQREIVWMGYLTDAQIGSEPQELAVSYNATASASAMHVYFASFAGVNQAAPIADSGAMNAAAATVTFGKTVNYASGGMTVVVAGNGGSSVTGALNAAPSLAVSDTNNSFGQTSMAFMSAVHPAAGSYPQNTAVTWAGVTSPWSGLVAVSLQP